MYLFPKASRRREREAQNARNNRAEVRKALKSGQVTKRELIKWGIFTAGGALVMKNGLSPFAKSSFADEPTGAPRSPLFNATPFSQPFARVRYVPPYKMAREHVPGTSRNHDKAYFIGTDGQPLNQPAAKRLSYHTDFNQRQRELGRNPDALDPETSDNEYANPDTGDGPMEGRPPGEAFAHQRWDEYFPEVGYLMFLGQADQGDTAAGRPPTYFHPNLAPQAPNSVWTYGYGPSREEEHCQMPPCLLKLRYGEPVLTRVYNTLPLDHADNGGFGRNETQLHFHNMHNGAESDGGANVHHFPGTFYDYRWSTALARADKINTGATDARASGPFGKGLKNVPGDFREIQGSMWAHDHRFFFTAENVYKGNLMMCNMYSGPDRGHDRIADKINLRLPSGSALDWGNTDFDVNIVVSDGATDADGQYFFDIFEQDGFIGDLPLINFGYKPVMKVLPRRYRFRLINACMSRFIKLCIADPKGNKFPITFIANDGNLVVKPLTLQELDEQGIAERYDIIVDFKSFKKGDKLHLVNLLQQTNGNKPDKVFPIGEAMGGKSNDPVVGALLRFEIVSELDSVDLEGLKLKATDTDYSQIPPVLTQQIPIVSPVRTRHVEFKRESSNTPQNCVPSCSEVVTSHPWVIRINGEDSHSFNANRISLLIPKAGEAEHWTYENGGGGWDHPIHLHFEEGVTMNRGTATIPDTEKLVRKDVWRLRPGGKVQFQVQFGEFGGSYVNHCHNTVHEDFAMLLRLQVLGDPAKAKDAMDPSVSVIRGEVTATPNPTPFGVVYTTPNIIPEGNPLKKKTSEVVPPAASDAKPTMKG